VLILAQFLFRLSFGLAGSMAAIAHEKVTYGFFQKHLWVIMGMQTLLAAALFSSAHPGVSSWLAATAAGLAYVGSVIWLYDARRAGMVALLLVLGVTCQGAIVTSGVGEAMAQPPSDARALASALRGADPITGGLLLGTTIAAMFLGHWYLNTPTMAIGPLQKLVVMMGVGILLRAINAAAGLACYWVWQGPPGTTLLCFIALRWLAGIVGAAVVTVMTWQTLKIPNTQSATGILYVGVIVTFLGELTAQLLSAESPFPL
jgi:hypothetical protein